MNDKEKLEIQLSRILALSSIINQNYETPTPEEAKAIVLGYMYQKKNWLLRLLYRRQLRKVNWNQVITDSMDEELFRDVAADLIKRSHVRL